MRSYIILVLIAASLFSAWKGLSEEPASGTSKFNELVWADEFDQPVLDTSRWKAITGDGCPELCGFGNNELQYYTDNTTNLSVQDGILVIRALKDSTGNKAYSSAKLVSRNKGDWKYGRIEVKAKIPEGRGTWPAIWMLPTLDRDLDWPLDGEIDIMEHVGYNQGTVYGTIHTGKYNGMSGTQKGDSIKIADIHEKFYVYALEWEEDQLIWSVNGNVYYTLKRNKEAHEGWPFTRKFHLILNLAVGGHWGGKYGIDDSIWPQTLEVDYVRVYQ